MLKSLLIFLIISINLFGTDTMLWLTDIHADKQSPANIEKLIDQVKEQDPSCICITGDIAENKHTIDFLNLLQKQFSKPVFFVLGNHDYYQTSIEQFSSHLTTLYKDSQMFYLASHGPVRLTGDTGIIGIDNWMNLLDHDNRPSFRLWDFDEIKELKALSMDQLEKFYVEQSQISIDQLRQKLTTAFDQFQTVYVLMHVPPFHPANFYDEETLKSPWRYYWSCDPIGQFLIEFMKEHPDKSIIVLSGHTHTQGEYSPSPNIKMYVGRSSDQFINCQLIEIPVNSPFLR